MTAPVHCFVNGIRVKIRALMIGSLDDVEPHVVSRTLEIGGHTVIQHVGQALERGIVAHQNQIFSGHREKMIVGKFFGVTGIIIVVHTVFVFLAALVKPVNQIEILRPVAHVVIHHIHTLNHRHPDVIKKRLIDDG